MSASVARSFCVANTSSSMRYTSPRCRRDARSPVMVYVLPEPVGPYAKTDTL